MKLQAKLHCYRVRFAGAFSRLLPRRGIAGTNLARRCRLGQHCDMSQPQSPDPTGLREAADFAAIGRQVRKRLDAHPKAFRIPAEEMEIYAIPGVLSADECARLIAIIDCVAQPSTLFDSDPLYRTSSSGDFDTSLPLVAGIEQRIDGLLGLDHAWGETIQGQRYLPGQEFRDHCDYFPTDDRHWSTVERLGGQRSWTAMAYLNPVAEGGATFFSAIGLTVPPQQGMVLAWNNMAVDGTPNPYTQHAGLPVRRGVKYIVTRWYRARRWIAEAWVD